MVPHALKRVNDHDAIDPKSPVHVFGATPADHSTVLHPDAPSVVTPPDPSVATHILWLQDFKWYS